MRILSLLIAFLSIFCSVSWAENIFLSVATADKKIILLNIEFSNNKYRVVDQASFNLPFQAGNTALGGLQNGNYQVVWTAQDASGKIRLNSMVFDANLNKVGNIKKLGPVLSSHFNLSILEPGIKSPNKSLSKNTPIGQTFFTYTASGTVYLTGRNPITGAPQSIRRTLLSESPPGFRPIITSFTCPSKDSDDATCYYSQVGSADNLQRDGVLFGNVDEHEYTSAYLFTNNVRTGGICGVSGTDRFNFVHGEYGDSYFQLKNRQFRGSTGQSAGPLVNVTARYEYPEDSSFPSYAPFGALAVVQIPGGTCHIFFTQPNPAAQELTFLAAKRLGSKGVARLDDDDEIVRALFYGLAAYAPALPNTPQN
jgi:hypothetical protein